MGLLRAQSDTIPQTARFIAGSFADFQVDNLGEIFVLTPDNQLKKYSAAGDSLGVFNDVRRFGKIAYIDVTNPLKLLLFYQEFGTIVILDRFLNNLGSLDLRQLGFYQVTCIGLAYDNNIWVYDALAGKLNKIANDGTTISQTNDIRQFTDSVPNPVLLTDQGGLVYLFDPQKGAYLFDHYGGYSKNIALKNWRHFSVINSTMLGWNGREFLKMEDKMPYAEEKKAIPSYFLPAIKILITPGYLYDLKTDGIHVYKN
jgi:glutaredoxin-related protein